MDFWGEVITLICNFGKGFYFTKTAKIDHFRDKTARVDKTFKLLRTIYDHRSTGFNVFLPL